MPDKRFFSSAGPFTAGKLAEIAGGQLADPSKSDFLLEDVAPLSSAGPKDLSFLDNRKYRDAFKVTKAGACIVASEFVSYAPSDTVLIVCPAPYKAYAKVATAFYPAPRPAPSVATSAIIHPDAQIADNCTIEDGVVIGPDAEIGEHCWIEANAVIGHGVVIGARSRIGSNASVSHAIIGTDVHIYPGCRIGQDGFGFAIDPKGHIKVPQLGRVIIEDHVEIGANTCIDRGAGPDTVIGRGAWIDNLVQIGHNVKIGKGCVIVGQAGVSGSSEIGDFAMLAGQAGIAGHLKVGSGAQVGAQAGVMRDIPAGQKYIGSPALPMKQFMRQIALLDRLVKKDKN